jgi:endonuclease YncB( thermonuclease family)
VIDGDTLDLAGERIRLWGIDAVEGDQVCQRDGFPWRCGDDATRALEALVNGRDLTCVELDVDRYGRSVATCTVEGQDIGAAMVRSGWALDFERYSRGAYAAQQLEAEQAERGLWSGAFVPPWILKDPVTDDARQQLAERVIEHLELSGFEIDDGDQVMKRRPPISRHG